VAAGELMRRWVTVGALVVSAVVCASRRGPVTPTTSPGAGRPRELLTFERTGCFGDCPTYNLVLFDDGGLRFAPSSGDDPDARDARIAPSAMANIQSNIRRLSGLRSDCCNCYDMTDMPSAIMTFRVAGGTEVRRIEHYHGCEHAPDWLYDVENAIDETLETERWLGKKVHQKPYHPSRH
jgi:hypothetical protein